MGEEWLRQRHHPPYYKTLYHHHDFEAVTLKWQLYKVSLTVHMRHDVVKWQSFANISRVNLCTLDKKFKFLILFFQDFYSGGFVYLILSIDKSENTINKSNFKNLLLPVFRNKMLYKLGYDWYINKPLSKSPWEMESSITGKLGVC